MGYNTPKMNIKQTQKLTQRMALTPQMKQSIHILALPILELKNYLENQMEKNPILEREKTNQSTEEPLSEDSIKAILGLSEATRDTHYNSQDYSSEEIKEKKHYRESLVTKQLNFQEHLLRQLRFHNLNQKDSLIGEYIIAHIDENGYLKLSNDEIADILNKAKSYAEQIHKKEVEKVLKIIQTFEPIGVGAKNLKECLLIQLKAKKISDVLLYKIVEGYLPEVARHKVQFISKKLKVPLEKVKDALEAIANLEPKPGRLFAQEQTFYNRTMIPDVTVEKLADKYEIRVNSQWLPSLKINQRYKDILRSPQISADTKKYIEEKIKSALWLVKSVAQREETIRKIADCIVNLQKEFLESGDPACLKPLNLKQVANKIGRNESTVSRVVNNKYIQTPSGIFKMNSFFSTHLKTYQGDEISTENIKSLIFDLISNETPSKPIKDSAIASELKRSGIKIARRTIAKYREELKILPYHQRKQK